MQRLGRHEHRHHDEAEVGETSLIAAMAFVRAGHLRSLTPVYPGDALGVRLTCKEINPLSGADHGQVRWDC